MDKETIYTDQNFEVEVRQFQGVALVDFWAPWCGPCQAMAPRIEQLAAKFAGNENIKIGKLNVDENNKTAGEFDIMSIPTIKIFAKGEEISEVLGLVPNEVLEREIEKALEKIS